MYFSEIWWTGCPTLLGWQKWQIWQQMTKNDQTLAKFKKVKKRQQMESLILLPGARSWGGFSLGDFDFLDESKQKLMTTLIAFPFCVCVPVAFLVEPASLRDAIASTRMLWEPIATLMGRVLVANKFYEVTCKLIWFCQAHGVPRSCQNFGRNFMWDTTHVADLLQRTQQFRCRRRR